MPRIVRGKIFKMVYHVPYTTYVITRSGKIGHLAGCPIAKSSKTKVLWTWANDLDLPPAQLAQRLKEQAPSTRLCKMCCSE
jgi:hypothetical protein